MPDNERDTSDASDIVEEMKRYCVGVCVTVEVQKRADAAWDNTESFGQVLLLHLALLERSQNILDEIELGLSLCP